MAEPRRAAGRAPAWDYTEMAASYHLRADYHAPTLEALISAFQLGASATAVDVGAGTGKLTALLCRGAATVLACEPNPAMRAEGRRNPLCRAAQWLAADGHALPLADASADLVSYGSSLNVLQPAPALHEAARVLRADGVLLAVWNHRALDDPLQAAVEAVIHRHLPDYDYGSRRQGPPAELRHSTTFPQLQEHRVDFRVQLPARDWLAAWSAHATLRRQAGARFPRILAEIGQLLDGPLVEVPYATRIWWARKRGDG